MSQNIIPNDIIPHTLTEKTPKGTYKCPMDCFWPIFDDKQSKNILQRRLKRKSWIFLSTYNADYFVGFAIIDAGYLAKAFCYVYELKTGNKWEDSRIKPIGFSTSFLQQKNEKWQLGPYQIHILNNQLKATFNGRNFQLKWQIDLTQSGRLFVCSSKGKKRPFHSTFKNLSLKQDLQIKTRDQLIRIQNQTANIDFSFGYPPRNTIWNWICLTGSSDCGKKIGFNAVDHFNESLENYIWIDDQPFYIGHVSFKYNKNQVDKPWQIDGKNVSLLFDVVWQRKEHLHIGLLKSSFVQVMGSISGTIHLNNNTININGYGVCEDHHSIW